MILMEIWRRFNLVSIVKISVVVTGKVQQTHSLQSLRVVVSIGLEGMVEFLVLHTIDDLCDQ